MSHGMPRRMDPRNRASRRLPGYDYRTAGLYFVTLVTAGRRICLGRAAGDVIELSGLGRVVQRLWLEIPRHFSSVVVDAFVVMPNHLHGVLVLCGDPSGRAVERFGAPVPRSLSTIIRSFKSATSRSCGRRVWQRGFYEHIVRDEEELARIRDYIEDNPRRWTEDRENPAAVKPGKRKAWES